MDTRNIASMIGSRAAAIVVISMCAALPIKAASASNVITHSREFCERQAKLALSAHAKAQQAAGQPAKAEVQVAVMVTVPAQPAPAQKGYIRR